METPPEMGEIGKDMTDEDMEAAAEIRGALQLTNLVFSWYQSSLD